MVEPIYGTLNNPLSNTLRSPLAVSPDLRQLNPSPHCWDGLELGKPETALALRYGVVPQCSSEAGTELSNIPLQLNFGHWGIQLLDQVNRTRVGRLVLSGQVSEAGLPDGRSEMWLGITHADEDGYIYLLTEKDALRRER